MIIKLNKASTLEQVEMTETEIRINLIQIETIEKVSNAIYGPVTLIETVTGRCFYVTQTPEQIDKIIEEML